MSEDRIKRKELLLKLDAIKRQKDWIDAVEALGFRTTYGGKHPYVIRDPENPKDEDITSLVATIPFNLYKQMNKIIFKEILFSPISARMGITEDMLWKALGLL